MNINTTNVDDAIQHVKIKLQPGSVRRRLNIIISEEVPGVGPIIFERTFHDVSFVKFAIPTAMTMNAGEEAYMEDESEEIPMPTRQPRGSDIGYHRPSTGAYVRSLEGTSR